MGRATEVRHLLDGFLEEIDSGRQLVAAAKGVRGFPGTKTGLHPQYFYKIVELSFLGVCAEWENFVDGTFVRYLTGASGPTGYAPMLKCSRSITIEHAYQKVAGRSAFNPARDFLSWTFPETVLKRAHAHFVNGEPFATAIRPFTEHLLDAATIRNRVAHRSDKCIAEFKTLARKLKRSKKLVQAYRPANLLLEKPRIANCFPWVVENHFDGYLKLFERLAREIVR